MRFAQSPATQVRKVMRLLELTKNTFAGPLARLIKEVANSKHEAAEISRHLAPLRAFVEELQAAATPVGAQTPAESKTASTRKQTRRQRGDGVSPPGGAREGRRVCLFARR
jgi:hypothetical protein